MAILAFALKQLYILKYDIMEEPSSLASAQGVITFLCGASSVNPVFIEAWLN